MKDVRLVFLPLYRLMFRYDLFILRNFWCRHYAVIKEQEFSKWFKAEARVMCRQRLDVKSMLCTRVVLHANVTGHLWDS